MSDLRAALAYALARAKLPGEMETADDYAARLAPLVIESGHLAAPPPEAARGGILNGRLPVSPADPPTDCGATHPNGKTHCRRNAGHTGDHGTARLDVTWPADPDMEERLAARLFFTADDIDAALATIRGSVTREESIVMAAASAAAASIRTGLRIRVVGR